MADNKAQATGVVYLDTDSAQFALDKLNHKIRDYDSELAKSNITQGRRITIETNRAEAARKAAEVQLQVEKKLGPTYKQQADLVYTLTKRLEKLPQNTQDYIDKLKQLRKEQDVLETMRVRTDAIVQSSGRLTKAGAAFGAFIGTLGANLVQGLSNGLQGFFSDAVEEAKAAEQSLSRLHNTLDNLGRADLFESITSKADELAKTFKFLDNDDITEVFQQLISYGKLTEKQMNDLLPVIINFSAKSGISVNESASVIIKALEGNGKALKDYGINMKEGATVTERMSIIMSQLKPKVEGAADAFSNTLTGAIAVSNQEIANTKEEIGTKLLPALKIFYSSISTTIDGLGSIFTNTLRFFSATYQAIQLTLGVTKDLISLNPTGAVNRIASIQAEAEAAERTRKSTLEIASARDYASKIAIDAASKTLAEQEKLLVQNKALKEASFNTYNELTKAGKQFTAEGKKASLQLFTDVETVKALQKVIAQTKDTRIVGIGDPNDDPNAEKEAQAKLKRQLEERQKLIKDYNDNVRALNQGINDLLTPDASKKMISILKEAQIETEKFNHIQRKGAISELQLKEALALVDKKRSTAIRELLAEEEKSFKAPLNRTSINDANLPAQLRGRLENQPPIEVPIEVFPTIEAVDEEAATKAIKIVSDRFKRDAKAGFDLELLNAGNNPLKKRKLLLQQLEEDHKLEMKNTDLTENEKLLKVQQFLQKKKEITKITAAEISAILIGALEFAGQVVSVLNQFNEVRNNKENADLKKELSGNEAKKLSYKKQLDSKIISQQRYNELVNKLDQDAEKKKDDLAKKQFERNKKFQKAQAYISGAQAVLKTIETFGPPFPPNFLAIGAMALTVGSTIASLAAISSAKYALGGKVENLRNGKITATPNVPTQPGGDNVLAMVKPGEVILNEDQQRRAGGAAFFNALGVPGFATGGRIQPFWRTRPYTSLNYPEIIKTQRIVHHYAQGGVFAKAIEKQEEQQPTKVVVESIASEEQMKLLRSILFRLENPVAPVWSLNKLTEATDHLDRIVTSAGGTKRN
jgi:hypothetical protein